jgi:hypothetical protein
MESTEITTAVESPLTNFQKDALDVAEKELETLREEVSNKKYLLDLDKKDLETLNKFIIEDATWKFTESLGIIEVEKEMKKAIKEGKLFTNAVAIEAIYYYMSKVEGNGRSVKATAFENVDSYLKVLKAITGGIEKVKIETEKVRQAEFVVAARREGIEPDASVTAQ